MSLSTLSMAVAAGFVIVASALEGPTVTVTQVVGCYVTGNTLTDLSVVWAPGQCQPDPANEGGTMIIKCSSDLTDDKVDLEWYTDSNCQVKNHDRKFGEQKMHGWTATALHEYSYHGLSEGILSWNNCERFLFPDVIRQACNDQPAGPDLVLTLKEGCDEYNNGNSLTVTEYAPMVWAPGKCQIAPSYPDTRSVIVGCDATNGGMTVKSYNGLFCEGEELKDYTIQHDVHMFPPVQENFSINHCQRYLLPEVVTSECGLPQPEGPEVVMNFVEGCYASAPRQPLTFIWAPGQCQSNPTEFEGASMIVECDAENGGMRLRGYEGGFCQGTPVSENTVQHQHLLEMLTEYMLMQDSCEKYELPDVVNAACTPPPTAVPTPAPIVATSVPTPAPVMPCADVVELANKRKHKKLCKEYAGEGQEAACIGAAGRYKQKFNERRQKWKRSCKPKRGNQISCAIVSTEHCCKFPGCTPNNNSCEGSFEGFEE